MTRGPRRLKDDPDFKWETGCDVADEARVVGSYDVAASKARLLAAIAALPAAAPPSGVRVGDGIPTVRPGASAWKAAVRPMIGAVTGAMVIAGAYWLGVQSGSADETSPAPPEQIVVSPVVAPVAPPVAVPEVGTEAPTVEAAPVEAAPAPARPVVRAAPRKKTEDPVLPPSVASEAAVAAPEAVVAPASTESGTADPGPEPARRPVEPTSQIKLEVDALQAPNDALDEARFADARKGYEAYLARFPAGKMRVEAQWGLLESLHGADDAAGTEALARKLQDLPAFSLRREELLRLRAESLVHLGRCDDALLVAEELPSRSGAEIRRACR